MCIILAAAEAFTLYVLAKMAERYSASTFGKLIHKALGKKLSSSKALISSLYPMTHTLQSPFVHSGVGQLKLHVIRPVFACYCKHIPKVFVSMLGKYNILAVHP